MLLPILMMLLTALLGCPDGSTDIVVSGNDDDETKSCLVDSECEAGQQCVNEECVEVGCQGSGDCEGDDICLDGQCVDGSEYICGPGQAPIVTTSLPQVVFGETPFGEDTTEIITITNSGDCRLRIETIGFSTDSDEDFSCDRCDPARHPYDLIPTRSLEVAVSVNPSTAGSKSGVLIINTDAETSEDDGIISIPVEASYSGEPRLEYFPLQIDFGFVEPESGPYTQELKIENLGTGNASAQIVHIRQPGDSVYSVPESGSVDFTIAPIGGASGLEELVIPITLDLSGEGPSGRNYEDELVVTFFGSNEDERSELRIPIFASSLTPPRIVVEHEDDEDLDPLVYETAVGGPIFIGNAVQQTLIVKNLGGDDLEVTGIEFLNDVYSEFRASPVRLAPIAGGGEAAVRITYEPATVADERSVSLVVLSNDPLNPSLTIELRGASEASDLHDYLVITSEFIGDTAPDFLGNQDIRNVDLQLTAQDGLFDCSRSFERNGVFQDRCSWSDGVYGDARWQGLSVNEDPERISVSGIDTQGAADGNAPWVVSLFYRENCSKVPSDTFNSIVDIAAGAAGSALGSEYGDFYGDLAEQVIGTAAELPCLDRDGARVKVTVRAGGELIDEMEHSFSKNDKGAAAVPVLEFYRRENRFVSE